MLIVPPALVVLRDLALTLRGTPELPSPTLIARTLAASGAIALIATLLAWPVAWWLRARGPLASAVVLAPMLLPSYLTYAGLGLLRAPGTWLGDVIARGPGPDHDNWYPAFAGIAQAILGLALWVWPLPAIILVLGVRRIDHAVLESLRLDGSRLVAFVQRLSLCRGSLVAAFASAMLLMLGSAIPLHVAQLDTLAIHLWRLLDQTPREQQSMVWLAALPLLVIAGIASRVIARSLLANVPERAEIAASPRTRPIAPALVLGVSVLLPAALFASAARSTSVLHTMLKIHGGALGNSLLVALVVGGLVAGVAMLTWAVLAMSPRALIVRIALVSLLTLGLCPGVLVGLAIGRAWGVHPALEPIAESWAIVVLAHVTRFGFLGVLAGIALARAEPRELVELRTIEGHGLRAWLAAAVKPGLPVILSIALASACLSFHEIESAVILEPPSVAGGSWARVMLQQLHFNRTRELAAGVLIVLALSVVALIPVLALAARRPAR